MTWTYPKTWVTGELVTAATLNTHVRDNLAHLKNNLKVTSTSFTLPSDYTLNVLDDDSGWVYTDTTNLKHTFVLDEDKTVILLATARVSESLANTATGDYAHSRFALNFGSGVIGGDSGGYIAPNLYNGDWNGYSLMKLIHVVSLASGTHTAYLQWRLNTNVGYATTIYAADPVVFTAIELPV